MPSLNRRTKILAAVLLLQIAGLIVVHGDEVEFGVTPLEAFPETVDHWQLAERGVVEKEVRDVLRADDLLSRSYRNTKDNSGASLFVAYFETQRTGKAPHSPKNCLPGSGWVPSVAQIVSIPVGPDGAAIEANQYVVSKGEAKSVVLYWYQSRDKSIASEYLAKAQLVLDSIRYRRSDTALIRVVVPVHRNELERATQEATSFAAAVARVLPRFEQFRSS